MAASSVSTPMFPAFWKLLRLLGLFWQSALNAELEYRFNFVLMLIGALGNTAMGVFGLTLLFQSGYQPGGWRFEEALLVVALMAILTGFKEGVLSPNLSRLVTHVQKGTLDFVLLKPIDPQLWLSTRTVALGGIPHALVGLGLLGYAGHALALPARAYALLVLPMLCSVLILYAMWFMVAATSIWFVQIYNATEVLNGLLDAGRFPRAAFSTAWRFVFTFLVPVAFLTTVPAEAMLGRASSEWLVGAVGLALLLLGVSRAFWQYALRFYTSASS